MKKLKNLTRQPADPFENAIYSEVRGKSYYLVGDKIDPISVGLEGKIGESKILVKVPKKLIDESENIRKLRNKYEKLKVEYEKKRMALACEMSYPFS